ncbi:MAG: PAS domain-containing sensor histidine kinase [Bacteroidetes bacterium]|nr:PAS domain-containing sensor histidine kinase [Bacteroidota bacterium]
MFGNNLLFIKWISGLSYVSLLFENENSMNDLNRTKKELLKELQELRQEHNELKAIYENDIIEIRKTEEKLWESKAKYQAIFESTGTATLIVEEDTTILMANKECHSITGYTPAELIGQKWIQYVAPDCLQEMLNNHQLRRQNPDLAPKKYEVKLVNKKGEVRDAILDIGMIPDTKQSVVSILDITERKWGEEALRKSEEQYRTLFENTGTSLLIVEEDTTISLANEEFAYRTGYTRSEIEGVKSWKELVYNIDIDRLFEQHQLRRVNSAAALSSYEFRYKNKAGELRYAIVNAQMVPGTKKSTVSILDITDRKLAEEELKLKNEQLIKVNTEKDKFFSVIAHDLRSPFNSLLGFTQLMVEELPMLTQDQIQNMAVNMRKSATSIYSLLENLLDWSRLQRGVITCKPAPILLLPKVSADMAMALESAHKKEIELIFNVPEDLVVFADENMLGGILRNLASNAVKFTPKCGEVTIAAKAIPDKGVEISVKDTGIGMTKEMIRKLFSLDGNTNRKGTESEPSSGLGLIICKEFIEKHGGNLWAESEEGKGTTFYFTLPFKEI